MVIKKTYEGNEGSTTVQGLAHGYYAGEEDDHRGRRNFKKKGGRWGIRRANGVEKVEARKGLYRVVGEIIT